MHDHLTNARLTFLKAGVGAVDAGLDALKAGGGDVEALTRDVRTVAQLGEDVAAELPPEMKAQLDRIVDVFEGVREAVAPTELDTARARRDA